LVVRYVCREIVIRYMLMTAVAVDLIHDFCCMAAVYEYYSLGV